LLIETTLWSDFPLENVSQGETIGGLQRLCLPLSEGLILKGALAYALTEPLSTSAEAF